MKIDLRQAIQRAMAALESGQGAQAEQLYERLVADYPERVDAHMCGGVIAMETHRPDAAITRFKRALRLDPDSFAALKWLTLALREAKRSGDALEYARRANRVRPNDPEILHTIGLCLTDLGDYPAAAEALEQAIALRPNEARHYARAA